MSQTYDWTTYEIKRKRLLAAVRMIPVYMLADLGFSALAGLVGFHANLLFALLLLPGIFVFNKRGMDLSRVRCPRCDQHVHYRKAYMYCNPYSRRCLNCGLKVGQRTDD